MAAVHGAREAGKGSVGQKEQHHSSNAKWFLVALLIVSVVSAIFVGLIAGGAISTAMLSEMWLTLQGKLSLKIAVGIGLSLVFVSFVCIGWALHRKKESLKQPQLEDLSMHTRERSDSDSSLGTNSTSTKDDNGSPLRSRSPSSREPSPGRLKGSPEKEAFSDDNWPPPKPYEGIGFRALQDARMLLNRATNIPTDLPEIARLKILLERDCFPGLKQIIVKNPQKPWENDAFVFAATRCMHISYAISSLALDDLGICFIRLQGQGKAPKHLDVLKENYYAEFFECPIIYSMLRGGAVLTGDRLGYAQDLPQAYISLFSKEYEQPKDWRDLYNDYCERVRYYFKDSLKNNVDKRYFNCSQPDPEGWQCIALLGERYKVPSPLHSE